MMCVMYEGRDLNFYVVHMAQTKGSIKFISNTHGGVMQ